MACDDQPIWMRTRSGPILSVPYPVEVNDSPDDRAPETQRARILRHVVDQFDEMLEQCVKHPLVCNISIHPYVFGQPFRLRPLRIALKHCVEHKQRDRVW